MQAQPWYGIALSVALATPAILVVRDSGDVFAIYMAAAFMALGPLVSGQFAMRRIRTQAVPLLPGAIIGALVLTGTLSLGVAVTGHSGEIAADIVFGELDEVQGRALTKHLWSIGVAYVSITFGTIALVAIGRWAARAVASNGLFFACALAGCWFVTNGIVSAVALDGVEHMISNAFYRVAGLPAILWKILYIIAVTGIASRSARVVPTG